MRHSCLRSKAADTVSLILRSFHAKTHPALTTAMPPFDLSVESFTPPNLPATPPNTSPAEIRSSLIPHILAPTSPLHIAVSLPHSQDTKPALYPATRLQLAYVFEGTGEIFVPNAITSRDLVPADLTRNLYEIEVLARDIPRAKVNHGMTSTAEVVLYAWKGEKLLGKWSVGRIEGLGIEGMKSNDLAISRAKAIRAAREVAV